VDVFSRRKEVWTLTIGGHASLLTRPRPVSPGKENYAKLVQDVRVGDVEVVLQSGDIDVAIELFIMSVSTLSLSLCVHETHVLFHVFLASHDGTPSDL